MLLGFVLAWAMPLAGHENVPGDPNPVHPQISPAQAAFDKLFWQIDDGVLPLDSPARTAAALARLQRAIPADDVHRRFQYRYMHCLIGFNHVSTGQLEYARDAVQQASRAGDVASEAGLRICLGMSLQERGQVAEALTEFERAGAQAHRARDYNVEGLAMVNRGHILLGRGEMARGLELLLNAQTVFERGKVIFQISFNLYQIAQAYRRIDDPDRALEYINRVEAFGRSRNDPLILFLALNERGRQHLEQGRLPQAEADLREALRLAIQENNSHDQSIVYLDLAHFYNVSKNPQRALAMLQANESVQRKAGELGLGTEHIDVERGHAYALLGEHSRALSHFDRALARLRDNRELEAFWRLYLLRADSLEALGALSAAMADLRAYDELWQRIEKQKGSERVLLLRHGFDARYRELERRRLQTQSMRAARLAEAERAALPWRLTSMALGLALSLVLVYLIWRQRAHSRGLRRMAETDTLTGAANRREIERIGAHALATGQPYGVMLLDLDHFKQVNDTYGHAAGDQVLVSAVAAWRTVLRQGDHLGRIGGEEFLVVLAGATPEPALQVAQRLLDATRSMDLTAIAPDFKVTVSIGLASRVGAEDTLETAKQRADKALYAAKGAGRDRVEVAPPLA